MRIQDGSGAGIARLFIDMDHESDFRKETTVNP